MLERKLHDRIVGIIDQMVRAQLGAISGRASPRDLIDTIELMGSLALQIKPLVEEMMDYLDVAKSERQRQQKQKESFDKIVAFYANMRNGKREILWEAPEGFLADVVAYSVRTQDRGDIPLPTNESRAIH